MTHDPDNTLRRSHERKAVTAIHGPERPTSIQIRSCLPEYPDHPMLRLMPFGPRAPGHYRQLQERIYETLAPGLSALERAAELQALWSLYGGNLPGVPDPESLLVEIARHVCDLGYSFQSAEVLTHAELHQRDLRVDEGMADGMAVSLPVLISRKRGPMATDHYSVRVMPALSRAIHELGGRSEADLAAMPEPERLAAIRLLRLYLMYGQVGESTDARAARAEFFDRLGLALWHTLMSGGFEPEVDLHRYGQPAIHRMQHALRSKWSWDRAGEADCQVEGAGVPQAQAAADTDSVEPEPPSGPMHLIVREPYPPGRDDDRAVLRQYERLRQPMPTAALPCVATLDVARAQLSREFPWAVNVIDAMFDGLRARRLMGGVTLGFKPILLTGPAGSGKSRLAGRLGEILGLPVHRLNAGGTSDAMSILGTSRGWSSGQPSPLLRPLLKGQATTLVVVDEVDKIGRLASNSPAVESALLPLLEPEEARQWRDNFLQVACDLRCLLWVMTCNDTTWMSSAFRSRVTIHRIRQPTRAEVGAVVDFAVRDLEAEWGLPEGALFGVPVAQMLPARIASLRQLQVAIRRTVTAWVNATAQGLQH